MGSGQSERSAWVTDRRERVTLGPFCCSDAVPHHVTAALRRPIRQRPRLIVAH